MNRIFVLHFLLLILLPASPGQSKPLTDSESTPPPPYNVLFLISDDMNDWIGCLGGHPDAITPNIDRLAERAVLFEQAHCSAPICNPSRASVMSGLNPSTTGCYGNRQALRMSPVGFEAVTLPRYFSNHGYFSTGVGKITHGKFPDPASWDDFYPNLRSQGMDGAAPPRSNMNGLDNSNFDWGPLDVSDSEMKDGKLTQHTIDMLAKDFEQPFFLACGWKLPHLTWHAPRKYFEMYDPGSIAMPLIYDDDLADLPKKALNYTENSYYKSVTKAGKEREGVQAYLACISFIDAQLGRVLDALDSSKYAENTIIVFWGDHGWHLGEKRHWSKSTLWEESTRAPLMIAAPGIDPGKCNTPVSFLDIYPTLVELAGLDANPELEGKSLVPLLKDPNATWDRPALTTHGKGNHSLRTKRWRYTLYSDGGEELYDHDVDEMEWKNLADDPAYAEVKEEMKKWLPSSDAEDVYVLQWPQEERKYWEATLKAAERYHGKSVYPEGWNTSELSKEEASGYFFRNIQAIDHWNLRYHRRFDTFSLEEQVAQIKANMDIAADLGFNSYLLFQKDAFQELLSWGGKHSPDRDLQDAVREVIAYGRSLGLDLFLHSNQFAWPDDVDVAFEDSEKSWEVFEKAVNELIETFPGVAGYEVTGDETEGQLDTKEGLLKFHNLTARTLRSDGQERTAFMRTWQRCEFLGVPEKELGLGDEPNLIYSIKNTAGDFRIPYGMDTAFIKPGVDGNRLLIEFDAWREYETHGIFPLYMGDYWAPRFRAIADLGISSVGVRFNWNSGRFHIGDTNRPWANWVNLYAFHRFTLDPYANPDEILMDFCREYFPEGPEAAFDMYKHTFDFIKAIYYQDDKLFLHHGGLNRPRGTPVDLDQVKQAYAKMKSFIDKIPDRNQYKAELQKYGLVISYLGRIAAGDVSVRSKWEVLDKESYMELEAGNAAKWQ